MLAVPLFVLSYQQKTRRGIILCNVVSRALYVLPYLLLGAFSGAVLDVLGMGASSLRKKDAPRIRAHLAIVILVTDVIMVAVVLLLYENPYSLLPIFGMLLHTGAFWLTRESTIRRLFFLGSPFWLVCNIAGRAYGSAVGDALTMVSVAVAMIRYDRLGRKSEKP